MTLFPIGEPGSEGKRIPVSGEIKEGRYALGDGKNLRPGMYRVEAYWHKKTGKQIPSGDPPNTVDETKQVVPEKYNKNSQTTVDIKAGANKLDLPLTSK
ncbi:MAG TPA: hypothetical protein VEL76_40015 [Gemmataceae bacterium]|nr:hypothetical protein [Gemmataceae bacterium]